MEQAAPPQTAEEQREMRMERNQLSGQNWKSFMKEPSSQWRKRKCNIYLHVFVIFIVFFSKTPNCGIPVAGWLAGQFGFLVIESLQ